MFRKIFNLIIFLSLLSSLVLSVEVIPATIELDYVQGNVNNFSFQFSGISDKINLDVKGDLADYITLSNESGYFCGGVCDISGTITIPDLSNSYGDNIGLVYGSEYIEAFGAAIALPRIGGKIRVRVPYPDEYLSIEEIILQGYGDRFMLGEDIYYSFKVKNRGSVNLEGVVGTINLKNELTGFVPEPIISDFGNLYIGQEKLFTFYFNITPDFDIGYYSGNVSFNYGGENLAVSSIDSFLVGDQIVKADRLSSLILNSGEINTIDVDFINYWVSELNCYSSVKLIDGGDNVMSTTTTKTFSIMNTVHTEKVFLDLSLVSSGDYFMSFETYCDDVITNDLFNISVVVPEENEVTDSNTEILNEGPKINYLFYVVAIILIILSVFIFYVLRKRKNIHTDYEDEFEGDGW